MTKTTVKIVIDPMVEHSSTQARTITTLQDGVSVVPLLAFGNPPAI